MLVLLHAYTKGFSAMEVAIMFSLYELMGAGTNLAAGVCGARWGIRATLLSGLTLQARSFAFTLVPVRPRRRGARRSLRTLPGASLRPGSLAFNPDAHTSTPFNSASDAFQLHPDIVASYCGPSTLSARTSRKGRGTESDAAA